MRTIINFKLYVLLAIGIFSSCSSDFLDEKPLDFLTTNNAFETVEDFDASVNNLYNLIREEFYLFNDNGRQWSPAVYYMGTDLKLAVNANAQQFGDYISAMEPTGEHPEYHWNNLYKIIAESNTVLSRLEFSEMSDANKLLFEARAKFFRAMAYRTLAYLYGGVPLIVEEITTKKTDFVRATRQQVYEQIIDDLKFAAANLPEINQVRDGEISKVAANHLLAEVYIANQQYSEAINAASEVIGNSAMALMTERFGRRTSVEGDVFWDLFQRGNHNRSNGNTEGIWVIQFETDVPGGSAVSSGMDNGYRLERINGPNFSQLTIGGGRPVLHPTSHNTGGRGAGQSSNTLYYTNIIWESDFENDMRNSKYNFYREFLCDNPAHPMFGEIISTENPPAGVPVPSSRLFAFPAKITTPGDHPDALYEDKETQLLKTSAGVTYADQYMFRLAETYLLRAEAYLLSGNTSFAAADINEVRLRANATPVQPGEVTIDYILDERMRELGIEEKRRLTLQRMGKLYDRVLLSHPATNINGLQTNADDIQPHHELWPIPYSAIEANTDAVLEQNPGYL